MQPSQGQFANVINLDQKRKEKDSAHMRAKSVFGPIQSNLVSPVTSAPSEETNLASPTSKESQ